MSNFINFFLVLFFELKLVAQNEYQLHALKACRNNIYSYSDVIVGQISGTGHWLVFKKILYWQLRRANESGVGY